MAIGRKAPAGSGEESGAGMGPQAQTASAVVPAVARIVPSGPPDPMAELWAMRRRASEIMERAKLATDSRNELAALREMRENWEIMQEFEGRLARRGAVVILQHPMWEKVCVAIQRALAPHPEASLAVSRELRALEEREGEG